MYYFSTVFSALLFWRTDLIMFAASISHSLTDSMTCQRYSQDLTSSWSENTESVTTVLYASGILALQSLWTLLCLLPSPPGAPLTLYPFPIPLNLLWLKIKEKDAIIVYSLLYPFNASPSSHLIASFYNTYVNVIVHWVPLIFKQYSWLCNGELLLYNISGQ